MIKFNNSRTLTITNRSKLMDKKDESGQPFYLDKTIQEAEELIREIADLAKDIVLSVPARERGGVRTTLEQMFKNKSLNSLKKLRNEFLFYKHKLQK